MRIRDILLPLMSYPAATGLPAIENAVGLASTLNAKLSAIACRMELASLAGTFVETRHVTEIVDAECEKNHRLVSEVISAFEAAVSHTRIDYEPIIARSAPDEYTRRLVAEAQLRELSLMPIGDKGAEQDLVEALLFESGRPVLIFPEEPRHALTNSVRNIALAWDFSGPATRAIADAFPFLERADSVRILTVTDEKPMARPPCSTSLADRLARHGFNAILDEISSGGAPIGEVFARYVDEHKIDLLVMGAYGHSRFREFVLGGATKTMLRSPPTWVLLSH